MKRLLITIFVLLAGARLSAQPLDCVMEHYSSLDGLPHNSISEIYQDREGFLWLSTWYGLSRFDGYTFRNFRTLPGDYSPLSHNRFQSVREDASGYLWVQTYDNHLYRFDRRTEQFTDIPGSLEGYAEKNYKVDRYLTTRQGDVWLAITGMGLMRYDHAGGTQNWFGSEDVGRKIGLLFEASDGRVFVASDRGIVCFEGADLTMLLREREATDVLESGTRVWFAIRGGVFTVDNDTEHVPHYGRDMITLPDGNDLATALAVSPDGSTIYIGTQREGVLRYDVATHGLTRDGYAVGRVRTLMTDREGTLWIVTPRAGITRWNGHNYKYFTQPMNVASYYVDTLARIVDDGSRVWVKMNGVGFGYYDRARDEVEPFFNRAGERYTNGVPCFMVDSGGVLWFSTSRRGLERVTFIDRKADVFHPSTTANPAAHEIRAALCDSQNRIWLGNKAGELLLFDASWRLLHRFADMGQVYAIFEDSHHNIWVGTKGNGVYRVSNQQLAVSNFRHSAARTSINNDQIYSIAEDRAGRIWFAMYGGGVAMLPDGEATEFVTPFNSFPNFPYEQGRRGRFIHCLPDGTMLLGGVEGLLVFNPDEPADRMQFRLVQKIAGDPHSLGNNDVIHILTDREGRTWLSTFGGGLNLLTDYKSDRPRFEVYSTVDGLSSNIVFATTEDLDGNLWLATENGISKFDPRTRIFTNLSRDDGIPPAIFSEATALTLPSGAVAFGTLDDLYIVNPAAVHHSEQNSRLAFTGFEIDNRPFPVGETLRLPYNYATFRIDFAALDFAMQSGVEYSYMLDGYDRDWILARGEHSAFYTNVPAGRYQFRVRAFADGSPTSDDSISITVRIATPPWGRWWAWLIYVAITGGIVWIVLRTIYAMLTLRAKLEAEQRMRIQFLTVEQELTTADEKFLKAVTDWMERHVEDPDITVDDLASGVNMGRTTMYNRLKTITGKSPVEFVSEYRMVRALQLLQSDKLTISEVAYRVGYTDPAYFSRRFKERYGVAPTKLRIEN